MDQNWCKHRNVFGQ